MFKHTTTKTFIKTTGKKLEKAVDALGESTDKIFDQFDNVFAKMGDVIDEAIKEKEIDDDNFTITTNHGHVVIVGELASLKVQESDYTLNLDGNQIGVGIIGEAANVTITGKLESLTVNGVKWWPTEESHTPT
jgi:hypothetical protein